MRELLGLFLFLPIWLAAVVAGVLIDRLESFNTKARRRRGARR